MQKDVKAVERDVIYIDEPTTNLNELAKGLNFKRKIVIPVDLSQASQDTSYWAFNNFLVSNDTAPDLVIFLNVREDHNLVQSYTIDLESTFVMPVEQEEAIQKQAQETSHLLLQRFIKAAKEHGIRGAKGISLTGDCREILETTITNLNPDVVIMGSRGLGSVSSFLLGSVSSHLLRTLKVPVLIVPPPQKG